MVENKFTPEQVAPIKKQVDRLTSPSFFTVVRDIFSRGKILDPEKTGLDLSLSMGLDKEEQRYFVLGFENRILRLALLQANKQRKALGTFKSPSEIPADPEILLRFQEMDKQVSNLMSSEAETAEAYMDAQKLKRLNELGKKLIEVSGDDPAIAQIRGEIEQTGESEESFVANLLERWFRQSYNSGATIASYFANEDNTPEVLAEVVTDQTRRVISARELVPDNARKIASGKPWMALLE